MGEEPVKIYCAIGYVNEFFGNNLLMVLGIKIILMNVEDIFMVNHCKRVLCSRD